MIHYFGADLSPEHLACKVLKNQAIMVSFEYKSCLKMANVASTVAADNGAYSYWKKYGGKEKECWEDYKEWIEEKVFPLSNYAFCLIPDTITGNEARNDQLISWWHSKLPTRYQGVPVWHTGESFARLKYLTETYDYVALGSSEQYDQSKNYRRFANRMICIFNFLQKTFGYIPKLHALRMLDRRITSTYPIFSADSNNLNRNCKLDSPWKGPMAPSTAESKAHVLIDRIQHLPTPLTWEIKPEQQSLWERA